MQVARFVVFSAPVIYKNFEGFSNVIRVFVSKVERMINHCVESSFICT